MDYSVSIIFNYKPNKWGYRGDPYLWDRLQQSFKTIPLPCPETIFMQHFDKFFLEITNHPSTNEADFFVEEFSHGGISSGFISIKFWQVSALPLLITKLRYFNNIDASIFSPVNSPS